MSEGISTKVQSKSAERGPKKADFCGFFCDFLMVALPLAKQGSKEMRQSVDTEIYALAARLALLGRQCS